MNANLINAHVVITAGGTGGHVFPALAVARELRRRGVGVSWIGTHHGLEARLVPAAGIDIDWIEVSGLRGNGALGWVRAPFTLLRALRQAMRALSARAPAAVLGMGGFVTGPVGVAAWLQGNPLLIHEQNAVSGLTNRVLARLARRVLEAFPNSLAGTGEKTVLTGNPLREEIAGLGAQRDSGAPTADHEGPTRLLVIGGSLGALALNENVPKALALVPKAIRPMVRHQAGEKTLEAAQQAYRTSGVEAEVTAFIEDMAEAYAWADFAICRAGAMTVAELAAAGLPAILVPFPHAVDDHQTANARYLSDAGAAVLCPQDEVAPPLLAARISDLCKRSRRQDMATAARSKALPDATLRVVDQILEVAGLTDSAPVGAPS
ncbi:MAG: undecaprenyldiphospho-muramoylpentapeptide beta-N-acetylglucosaminyltransferase [Gammaproteobacteria bacterium]|nr:undecaprenyldiphospho-muramoylpentapeptide beta-N-acetylglucosaminyltransferase [Gammaproteobacteria bacterium]MCP5137236.1 undecaprenyldiphospho-muramoylpentapeptide beta-N-acetylglucosaminyltransferase [Gammaproteobacteria bacterium]